MEILKKIFYKSLTLMQFPFAYIGIAYLDSLKWESKSLDMLTPLFYIFMLLGIAFLISMFHYLTTSDSTIREGNNETNENSSFTIVE